MVRRVEVEGWTAKATAAAFTVSERTVRKWLVRFRAEGLAGLPDRSSRAHRVANAIAVPWVTLIIRLRRDDRMTAAEIAARLDIARSTVAGHLQIVARLRSSDQPPEQPAGNHT